MSNETNTLGPAKPTLDAATAAKVRTFGWIALAVGVVLTVVAFLAGDKHAVASSYLVGFLWAITIALGGLFWPIVWRLTKAGWPVATRRHMEWFATFIPIGAILFIPIILTSHDIYHHWMSAEAKHDPILIKKAAWLNETGFYVRAFIYFAIWSGLALLFRRLSFKQDQTNDKTLTTRAQIFAAPAVAFFALSISFAGFDWVMSIDPHWYSTIFGVYIFAGAGLSSMCLAAIVLVRLRSWGLLGKVATVEHQHDLGKMLFGFIVFWAYIAFSQFILIWYANIPEETVFFNRRWYEFDGSWRPWSLLLLFGHFFIPFALMLSRWAKRINWLLVTGATLLLAMHYVDLYWLVKPNFGPFHFSWVDIATWAGPAGVLFCVIAQQMAKGPIYAINDPRIAETSKMENI
jgi:hypothetical protein